MGSSLVDDPVLELLLGIRQMLLAILDSFVVFCVLNKRFCCAVSRRLHLGLELLLGLLVLLWLILLRLVLLRWIVLLRLLDLLGLLDRLVLGLLDLVLLVGVLHIMSARLVSLLVAAVYFRLGLCSIEAIMLLKLLSLGLGLGLERCSLAEGVLCFFLFYRIIWIAAEIWLLADL
jgi:hypothetical protein